MTKATTGVQPVKGKPAKSGPEDLSRFSRQRRRVAPDGHRRSAGVDDESGFADFRQSELPESQSERSDAAGRFHPAGKNHSFRPRANSRAHRPCPRYRRTWLFRTDPIPGKIHDRQSADRSGRTNAAVHAYFNRGRRVRFGRYPARCSRLRRQVLHERGQLGFGRQ